MICYKDMTFCTENTCKKRSNCPKYFTESDREAAIKWWGNENFPLAVFVSAPTCFAEELWLE